MKNSYKYVISLGCMCSNALSLRQIGLRESSGFFDWLNSSLSASMKIIENNFTDILNIDFLSQDFAEQPRIVTNTFYGFSFVHLFNPKKTFDAQKKKAELYIKKQIENSRRALESGECLCIYYCRDINEQKQIEESFISDIYPFFSERKIDILFIFNYKPSVVIENFDYYVIEQNNIHRPFGGGVTYPFIFSEECVNFLISIYPDDKRKSNLAFEKKQNGFTKKLKKKIEKKSGSFSKNRESRFSIH